MAYRHHIASDSDARSSAAATPRSPNKPYLSLIRLHGDYTDLLSQLFARPDHVACRQRLLQVLYCSAGPCGHVD